MKTYLLNCLWLLCVAMLWSCGPSDADRTAALEAATEKVEIAHAKSVDVDGDVVTVKFQVADSLVDVAMISPDLMDVVVAEYLKNGAVENAGELVSALIKNKAVAKIELSDVYGGSKEFEYSGERLRSLLKAHITQLNVSAAKANVVEMAMTYIPPTKGETPAVETSLANGFINYTMDFPMPTYINNGQGLLTLRYRDWLAAHYAPGTPIVELLQTLGVEGIRVTYTSTATDKELKQSFPWRSL